jgi:hypothetical protein
MNGTGSACWTGQDKAEGKLSVKTENTAATSPEGQMQIKGLTCKTLEGGGRGDRVLS